MPDEGLGSLLGAEKEIQVNDLELIEDFVGDAKHVQSELIAMDKNNDKLKGIIKEQVYNNRAANQESK